MLQQDAINAFQSALKEAFDANPKLKWIVVPLSIYAPELKKNLMKTRNMSGYVDLEFAEQYHQVQPPVVVTPDIAREGLLRSVLAMRRVQDGHEMALGIAWMCGFADTSTKYENAQIFDGAPDLDLSTLNKRDARGLEKYTILNTGNSYHFYLKGNPLVHLNYTEQQVRNNLIDHQWDEYMRESGGYIRVSAFVKGGITKL